MYNQSIDDSNELEFQFAFFTTIMEMSNPILLYSMCYCPILKKLTNYKKLRRVARTPANIYKFTCEGYIVECYYIY